MKKSILILAIIALIGLAFIAPQQPQPRQYNLTESQVHILFMAFETAKKTIPNSDVISAQEANQALMAIDSIGKVFLKQNREFVKQDSITEAQRLQELSQPSKTDSAMKNFNSN